MILLQNVWKSLNNLRGEPVRPAGGRRLGPQVAVLEEEKEEEEARKKKQNLHTG